MHCVSVNQGRLSAVVRLSGRARRVVGKSRIAGFCCVIEFLMCEILFRYVNSDQRVGKGGPDGIRVVFVMKAGFFDELEQ